MTAPKRMAVTLVNGTIKNRLMTTARLKYRTLSKDFLRYVSPSRPNRNDPAMLKRPIIARATEAGLLDDEAHARHFIETRFARGRGPARLRLELAQAGIPRALTDRLLAEVVSEEDVDRRMLSLAQKRASQLQHLPRPDRVRRVTAFLARRGYRGLAVRDTVREVVGS